MYSGIGIDGVDCVDCVDSGGVVLSYQTTLGADTLRYSTVHSAFNDHNSIQYQDI